MMDFLEISKKVWFWIKWSVCIVASIFIFLGVTQLVECFGVDASNKFAGIFTPLIVALVTIYLSNRQHNIADAQRAVSEESKNIAAANREIADKKMKLELFEKRFVLCEIFNQTYMKLCSYHIVIKQRRETLEMDNGSSISNEQFLEIFKETAEELYEFIRNLMLQSYKVKFLFSNEVYKNYFLFSQEVNNYVGMANLYQNNGIISAVNNAEIEDKLKAIGKLYGKILMSFEDYMVL